MDKTAQKRSLLNKLHEMANIPARSAENFFKPELKRIMNSLISVDDVVRSTLTGEKIGKASPEDPVSAKDLLKEAKSFINRREYLSAAADLGRFHKKMQDVSNVLEKLEVDVNSIHHQFLFNKLPGKHREQLEEMRTRLASERLTYFTKEAGITDFFRNIGTPRGRALAAWEKRYPQVVGKIRDGAVAQLESSQELLNDALAQLKVMASARAARNIDVYISAGKELSRQFKKYDSGKHGFRGYYNEVIKPYLDMQKKIEEDEKATSATSSAVNNMLVDQSKKNLENADPFGNPAKTDPAVAPAPAVPVPTTSGEFGHISIPGAPALPTDVGSPGTAPVTPPPPPVPSLPTPGIRPPGFKSDEVAEELFGPKKSSYDAFIDSLQVFSNEDPSLLAAHISKYAKSIQGEQPEVAVKLFKIAKSLRG